MPPPIAYSAVTDSPKRPVLEAVEELEEAVSEPEDVEPAPAAPAPVAVELEPATTAAVLPLVSRSVPVPDAVFADAGDVAASVAELPEAAAVVPEAADVPVPAEDAAARDAAADDIVPDAAASDDVDPTVPAFMVVVFPEAGQKTMI